MINVENLRMRYASARGGRAVDAVRGLSFHVDRGEVFALLGPNGAGKSTTVEILEGYRARTGGAVSVLGVDPFHAPRSWKTRVGIVLQSAAAVGPVTVRELLTHFAGYYPHARGVDEVIDAVGLRGQARVRVRSLSGGQRRRVDVALGIIGRPDLLFLDEPTTGFDPEARRRFWRVIDALHAEGTTVVLTTHYLDEAARLSDRVAVINRGTLVDVGPADAIGGPELRVPVVRWREGGVVREERTATPGGLIVALQARLGAEPELLEVVRPSLEDVYLALVGAGSGPGVSAQPTGVAAPGTRVAA